MAAFTISDARKVTGSNVALIEETSGLEVGRACSMRKKVKKFWKSGAGQKGGRN